MVIGYVYIIIQLSLGLLFGYKLCRRSVLPRHVITGTVTCNPYKNHVGPTTCYDFLHIFEWDVSYDNCNVGGSFLYICCAIFFSSSPHSLSNKIVNKSQ